jgi:peptidoglycan/LPS O-acetylase OafA/YrhL
MRTIPMRTMTHDEFQRLRHFSGLDGLRAVAALMVVAYHFGGPGWGWLSGWSGVHVFFVLSGFLITTLALREEDRRGRLSLPDFYVRRFFRIVPVYLVVVGLLVAQVAYVGRFGGSALARDMPYLLTFMNEYAPNMYFVQSWTLGIEQKFYLVWPLLAFAFGALAFARRVAVTVATVACGLGVFFLFLPSPTVHYLVILSGCLLALVMHQPRAYALVRPLTHPVAALGLAGFAVVAQVALAPVQKVLDQPTAVLLYGVCITLFLPAVLAPGPVRWLLSIAPMRFVGERSYGVYLVQGLAGWVIGSVIHLPAGDRLVLLASFVSLAIADVLYRTVERPFIAFGRTLIDRRRARAARKDMTPQEVAAAQPETAITPPEVAGAQPASAT